MTILLLRPKEKIFKSTEYLQQAGIKTVGVGLVEIEPMADNIDEFKARLKSLSIAQQLHSYCVFVSTHAADIISHSLPKLHWPDVLRIYAVGPSTGHALAAISEQVHVPDLASSEGLLALPSLQELAGKSIYLMKGVGGRPLLYEEFSARGAKVIEVDLYQRHPCSPAIETQPWQPDDIQCLVATSGEIMQLAWDYFDTNWLKSIQWIVVSRRLVEFAAKLGIANVIQSAGASDEQLKDAINKFLER